MIVPNSVKSFVKRTATGYSRNGKFEFVPGEMVRIKKYSEIVKTLDADKKSDGILFTGQMAAYCGGIYRNVKTGSSLFSERHRRSYKSKTPFCILENLICDGNSPELENTCDHGCYLIWHQSWLDKVQE